MKDNESKESPYIRFMGEFPELGTVSDVDVDSDGNPMVIPLRVAICMSKENSLRLSQAHYLQSDIGFKRIVGFKEFELGALDALTRTSE